MAEKKPIIIKRVKKVMGHGHHGGAWKIAYADFVTAMMAFFLLMWLLASTTEDQRRGISDYFQNPMKVSLMGGDGVGEQTRPIPGGGEDFRLSEGEVARIAKRESEEQAEAERSAHELERLEQLKNTIEAAIDEIPTLQQFKGQLLLDLTSEGLRIQIVDRESRPMFDSGSAQLKPYARELLAELSVILNKTPNRLSISGHTDATPFSGGAAGYSNWELSNDRANSARRELVAAGLYDEKVMRVVGLASTVLLDKDSPTNPMNRRISIVVMNRDAEQAIERDGEEDSSDSDAAGGPSESTPPDPGADADAVGLGEAELTADPGVAGRTEGEEPRPAVATEVMPLPATGTEASTPLASIQPKQQDRGADASAAPVSGAPDAED
jgi:chemotaxis protein MotB